MQCSIKYKSYYIDQKVFDTSVYDFKVLINYCSLIENKEIHCKIYVVFYQNKAEKNCKVIKEFCFKCFSDKDFIILRNNLLNFLNILKYGYDFKKFIYQ